MKAAIVKAPNTIPIYADFPAPVARAGFSLVRVTASGLSNFTKLHASGSYYSSDGVFPAVAGVDGVGTNEDGQRVYFILPEAPFGSLGELSLVRSANCIPLADQLDDVTAAAIANAAGSAMAAIVDRGHLRPGETVLVNGGTSSAGRLAIQISKYLGARKVIATGRNQAELNHLKSLGADVVLQFASGPGNEEQNSLFEAELIQEFENGIDLVIDYLWGQSAKTIISAVGKGCKTFTPVRFVHVGSASGEDGIEVTGVELRSSPILLMGSGYKSIDPTRMFGILHETFDAVVAANLQIETKVVPLSRVTEYWDAPGKPRIVFTI